MLILGVVLLGLLIPTGKLNLRCANVTLSWYYKISGIAIKCYVDVDLSSDDMNIDVKRKEMECAKSVTQCAKVYGSDEGGKVFSDYYFFL